MTVAKNKNAFTSLKAHVKYQFTNYKFEFTYPIQIGVGYLMLKQRKIEKIKSLLALIKPTYSDIIPALHFHTQCWVSK